GVDRGGGGARRRAAHRGRVHARPDGAPRGGGDPGLRALGRAAGQGGGLRDPGTGGRFRPADRRRLLQRRRAAALAPPAGAGRVRMTGESARVSPWARRGLTPLETARYLAGILTDSQGGPRAVAAIRTGPPCCL